MDETYSRSEAHPDVVVVVIVVTVVRAAIGARTALRGAVDIGFGCGWDDMRATVGWCRRFCQTPDRNHPSALMTICNVQMNRLRLHHDSGLVGAMVLSNARRAFVSESSARRIVFAGAGANNRANNNANRWRACA